MRIWGNLSLTLGLSAGLDRGKLTTNIERTATAQGVSFPTESWSEIRMLGRAGLIYSW